MSSPCNVYVADNLWRGKIENLNDENGKPVIDLDTHFFKKDLSIYEEAESVVGITDYVVHLADIVAGIDYVFSNQGELFRVNNLINSNLFVGMYSPPFRALTEEEDKKICDEINALKPDFLWVGIGAPKQEMWMWQHQEKINNTVMFGVGAGFNFFAGTLDKAPEWMEKASLEWLFRLSKEPKRLWRRYILGGFKYLYYTAEYKLKKKK